MIPLLLVGAAYLIGKTMKDDTKKYHLGGNMSKHLAPNGKPSKLTHEQWHLVRTHEFKAWFGDWENDAENASKVVDEDTKEPLVVYHGTDKKINAFRINAKNPYSFWAVNKEYAKQYSKDYIKGAREYECFLNIRNPFDSTNYEFTREQSASRLLNLIFKKIDKDKKNNLSNYKYKYFQNELYSHINMYIKDDLDRTQTYLWWLLRCDGDSYNDVKKNYSQDYAKQFKNKKPSFLKNFFINFGYDGIIQYENIHGEEVRNYPSDSKKYPYYASKVYVVFKPEQIKLADGTNITFDGDNLDIRFQNGGKTPDNVEGVEDEMENFDWSKFFTIKTDEEILEQKLKEQKEIDDFNKYIESKTLIIDNDILKKEKELDTWQSKQYKSNPNMVFIGGDDVHGMGKSIGGINEARKQKRIRGIQQEIETLQKAKQLILNYDLDRGDILQNLMDDYKREDYTKKGKRISYRDEAILDDAYSKVFEILKNNS